MSENLLDTLCIKMRRNYHERETVEHSVVWIDWRTRYAREFFRPSMTWINWRTHYGRKFIGPFMVWIDETSPPYEEIYWILLNVDQSMWLTMVWLDRSFMKGNLLDFLWYEWIWQTHHRWKFVRSTMVRINWWWLCHERESDGLAICKSCDDMMAPF